MKNALFLTIYLSCLFTALGGYGQCCNCASLGNEQVYNGDFESGNTGFNSAYQFSTMANPGRYGITTNSNSANPAFWKDCKDHTSGLGKFMWLDLSNQANLNIWSQTISSIQPNKNYLFSCWINTLDPRSPAMLRFSINGLPAGNAFSAPGTDCQWMKFCFIWYSGYNTSAVIAITNKNLTSVGNDIGIDDISFRECTTPLPMLQEVEAIVCPGSSYQLFNGTTVSLPGTYHDTVTASVSCDTIRNIHLKIASVDTGIFSITLCSSLVPYTWNNHTYAVPGVYQLRVTSALGCDSIATLRLATYPDDANCTIYFPNSFTPNNDSKNDRFKIIHARNFSTYQLTVYNRLGQKIFDTKDSNTGWDGTYNGNPQEVGAYIWFCRYRQIGQPEMVRKGFVVLIR